MGEGIKEKLAGSNIKKYLPMIGVIVAVIVVIVLLISIFGGGPKKAVKNFVKGMDKLDASKVIKSMDFAGSAAWSYSYMDDFDEDDYEEFLSDYEDVDPDDIEEAMEQAEEFLQESFDNIEDEYDSYKMKIEEFKDVEEIAKDLYEVKVKIAFQAVPADDDEDEIDESEIMTFIVYKNKIIYTDSGLF